MTGEPSRKQRLRTVFDPGVFKDAAGAFAETLTRYYTDSIARATPALPWCDPEMLVARAREMLAQGARSAAGDRAAIAARFRDFAEMYLSAANHLHSPKYMGHQVPAALPLAGLAEALGNLSNQGMAVYEMGPMSTAAEHTLGEWLGRLVGWPADKFGAIATHGGAAGNLTAILAARNARLEGVWENGVATGRGNGRLPAIITGADSHYSVARSAGILGLGTAQVLKAPLDRRRRVDPAHAEALLDEASRRGLDVFCIIASACSTPTGSFDPITELADLAERHGLWLHVDGAHGASVLLSPAHRHKVRGIERADSIVWDAHKMMFMPALCTFVLYREKAMSFRAFWQDAPYLFDPAAPDSAAIFDSALRTLECTKRSMALGLFGAASIIGPGLFEDLVDETFALCSRLHRLLLDAGDFETIHEPEANIICFRHVPHELAGSPRERISAFQKALRKRLIESGEYYITQTVLDGQAALRVTVMNPLIEEEDLVGLLDALRRHGRALLE